MDESAIPFRRKEDHLKRGGGSSTANQIWIAGAVERRGRFAVGRIRLARIADRSSASLIPFVLANTEPGSHLRTDENSAYRAAPDRRGGQFFISPDTSSTSSDSGLTA
ncbi:transposase [Sinorhizobium saheli]|uniref:transposase n=1 Tax=Sinorhizobium saheli TaxID=36856 RepID=UPI000A611262|nr:transposase [Sinorhizobium saheli]